MIIYVDFEHRRLRQNATLWNHFSAKTLETKYKLEEISGDHCLIVRYNRLTPTLLHELNIAAVVVGGQYTALPHYTKEELAGLRAIFKEAARPTIGLCGGFQVMVQTFGADFGPMEPPESGNADDFPETPIPPDAAELAPQATPQNVRQEQGFMPVRIVQAHPLLRGLGPAPVFYQLHSWEVKTLPDEFLRLAETDLCKVQIVAHKTAPLFGVQFHPEQYDDTHPGGRKILENFFKVAGVLS